MAAIDPKNISLTDKQCEYIYERFKKAMVSFDLDQVWNLKCTKVNVCSFRKRKETAFDFSITFVLLDKKGRTERYTIPCCNNIPWDL